MTTVVIVQPDDRLAVFSTVTGTLVIWDATDAEIVAWFVDDARRRELEAARWAIARARAGKSPRSAPNWFDAVTSSRRRYPNEDWPDQPSASG